MREFKTKCIDNVTGMEMVLSETSFNFACSYLEEKSNLPDCKWGKYLGTEYVGENVSKLKWENVIFYYDETRGILMRK